MHRMQSGGWPYSKVGKDSSKAPSLAGADPEVEEGGTHRVGLVGPCGARSAPNFSSRTYDTQHSRRVWGHAQENF